MGAEHVDGLFPLACRFVATDQWIVSQFDSSWKISELKQYILSRVTAPPSTPSTATFTFATPTFSSSSAGVTSSGPYDTNSPNNHNHNNNNNARYPYPPRHRPVSPITFAAVFKSRPSFENPSGAGISEDGHGENVGAGAVGGAFCGSDGGGGPGLEEEDFEEDDYLDMNDDSDLDYPHDGPTRPALASYTQQPSALQPSASLTTVPSSLSLPPTTQYSLISFSTGMILEDSFSLAWYHLRPNELLELHPLGGSIAELRRGDVEKYVKPYFEARVRALRVIGSADAVTSVVEGKEKDGKDGREAWREKDGEEKGKKRKKAKLEWRERWVVVHQGTLSLFKDRADSHPAHTSELATLCQLRGADALNAINPSSPPATSSSHHPYGSPQSTAHYPHSSAHDRHAETNSVPTYVICAKFRATDVERTERESEREREKRREKEARPKTTQADGTRSAGTFEGFTDPWSGANIATSSGGVDEVGPMMGRRGSLGLPTTREEGTRSGVGVGKKRSGDDVGAKRRGSVDERNGKRNGMDGTVSDTGEDDGVWVVLDMVDLAAFTNLLRILHREAPLAPSVFYPPPSASSSASSSNPLQAYNRMNTTSPPLPYPEWRTEVARKAQRVGMGEVGAPMALVLWGPDEEDSESERESVCPPSTRKRGDTDSSGVSSFLQLQEDGPGSPAMTPLAKTESGSTARRRPQNQSQNQKQSQSRNYGGVAEGGEEEERETDSRDAHASFDLDEELGMAMEMVTDSSDDGLESECEWDGWALDLPRQARKAKDAQRRQQIQREMQMQMQMMRNGHPVTPTQSHFTPTAGRERLGSAPSSMMVPPSISTSIVEVSTARGGAGKRHNHVQTASMGYAHRPFASPSSASLESPSRIRTAHHDSSTLFASGSTSPATLESYAYPVQDQAGPSSTHHHHSRTSSRPLSPTSSSRPLSPTAASLGLGIPISLAPLDPSYPALLTVDDQGVRSGTTTSTVSVGGVVRNRSLVMVEREGGGGGVPRALGLGYGKEDRDARKVKGKGKAREEGVEDVITEGRKQSWVEELGLGRKVKEGHVEKKGKAKKKDKEKEKEKDKAVEGKKKEKSLPALPPVDPEDDLIPAPPQHHQRHSTQIHSSSARTRPVAAAVPPPTSYTSTTTTPSASLTSPSSSSFDTADFTQHPSFGMKPNDHNAPHRHRSGLAKTEWKRLSAALGGIGGGTANRGGAGVPDGASSSTSPPFPPISHRTARADEDPVLHRTETRHTIRETDARSETKSSNSGGTGGSSGQSVGTTTVMVAGEKEKEKEKGKGKKLVKGITRGKAFSPEKWVKGFDAALDFVDGV